MPLPTHSTTIVDYNGETSTTTINLGPITAVNLPTVLSQISDWRAAIGTVIIGNQRNDKLTAYNSNLNSSLPSSTDAQVERKWQITYVDSTAFFDVSEAIPNAGFGKFFQVEIATADSSHLENNSEFLDLNSPPGNALVDAFEVLAKSPYGGTPQVYSIELVGRTR